MPKTYELALEDYWRIIKRRKAIVIATFVLITGAIFTHASRLPRIYSASATIKIERQASVQQSQVDWDTDFLETQMQVINSRGVGYEAGVHAGLIKDGMSVDEINEMIGKFSGVSPQRRGRTNIVDLSMEGGDPEDVAMVVNMVARGFQTWSLKDHAEQARQVRMFVEKQLKESEEKLVAKEEELRRFKEESPTGSSIAAFQSQLVNMELELSDMLEKYTGKHPEVIEQLAKIETLRQKLGRYPELELQLNQLTRDIESTKAVYGGLKQRFEEARTAEAQNISGVTLLNRASVPGAPIAPNVFKSTMLGGVIALILGLLMAFVKENVDTSIATIEEVEDFLQVPILGVIPEMVKEREGESKWSWRRLFRLLPLRAFQRSSGKDVTDIKEVRKLVMLSGEEHQFSPMEAYKTLRTNILFAVGEKKGQVLEVTSTGAREGKSLTSLNMALTLAQSGNKTCLISADLRRETISRMLGISKEPGLVDILTKDVPWQEVVRKTTDFLVGELPPDRILQTIGIDNFHLIASGRLPMNPAEILSLKSMDALLKELRTQFDFVIIDTPPVLPVSDPSVIAPKVDGVIMVYQVGRTARGALKRAKVQITSTGAKLLGVVLNNIKASEMKMAPSYYYYQEYYGPDEKLVRERRKREESKKHWWQRLFTSTAE